MKVLASITTAAVVLVGILSSTAIALDLTHEHAGSLIKKVHRGSHDCLADGVINNGTPVGRNMSYDGNTVYLSFPPGRWHEKKTYDTAILYFTDIFGNALVNNRLLADSIAKAGYFVAMPDLFHGDPVPADALSGGSPGFNMTAWVLRHPLSDVEAIIESTISALKTQYKVKTLGAVGYCFGGRYVARFMNGTRGVDIGFAAHPAEYTYPEWQAVSGPISLAFGAMDVLNPTANRSEIENIFISENKTFQTSLYAKAQHGFGVRTNTSDPVLAFAQEGAYFQAVRWFDYWLPLIKK